MKPSAEAIRAAVRLGSFLRCSVFIADYSGATRGKLCDQYVVLHPDTCGCFAWCRLHGRLSVIEVRLF